MFQQVIIRSTKEYAHLLPLFPDVDSSKEKRSLNVYIFVCVCVCVKSFIIRVYFGYCFDFEKARLNDPSFTSQPFCTDFLYRNDL